jgi:hypothetical protein
MTDVIIDGPDGGGKSSLARYLCDRYGYAYHHESGPPTDRSLGAYAALLSQEWVPTVFDRHYLSEVVYGPLLRGGSCLSDEDVTAMRDTIDRVRATVIVCLPPRGVTLANSNRPGEYLRDPAVRAEGYDRWVVLVQRLIHTPAFLPRSFRVYDYTVDDVPTLSVW